MLVQLIPVISETPLLVPTNHKCNILMSLSLYNMWKRPHKLTIKLFLLSHDLPRNQSIL